MSRLTSQPPPPHPTSRSFVSCSWGNLQLLTVVWSLASYFPRWSWQSARDSSFRISAGFLHRTSAYSCLLAASCGGWGGGGGRGGDFLSHSNFSPFCIFAFWLMNDDPKQRDEMENGPWIWTVSVASDLLLCNHIKCIWSCHQSIILALDIQKISL